VRGVALSICLFVVATDGGVREVALRERVNRNDDRFYTYDSTDCDGEFGREWQRLFAFYTYS
jgi:hypothetical protein